MEIKPLHVKYKRLHPQAKVPTRAYEDDGAYDLYAVETLVVKPGDHINIGCGLAVEVGKGWSYDVRGRSGLTRIGIIVGLGLCDAFYNGELRAVISNFSRKDYEVIEGERICQIKFNPVFVPQSFVEVQEFEVVPGTRGAKGWGSSGRT